MTTITPEYLTKIAPRLRAARESSGLSVGQVRQYFAIMTLFDLQALEKGLLPPQHVTDDQLDKLCAAYRVTRDEIEAEPLTYISDDEMWTKIRADRCERGEFERWLKIDRWLMQQERAGSRD